MRYRGIGILVVALTMALGSGCVRPWGPEDVRRDLGGEAGVELDREFGLTVTRTGMMLARLGLKIAGEDEIPLRGVRRVEVGVYQVEGREHGLERPAPIAPPELEGWETVLRIHEDGEDIVMQARMVRDDVRRLLLVVAQEDEWVIVRIRGKLRRVLEGAIQMAFDEAGRPELYERAEREPGWEREDPKPVEAASLGS